MTKIAVLTFDGFNEIDSFLALNMLNRLSNEGFKAEITSPTTSITSMNGVHIHAQKDLSYAREADVVIVGSGIKTEEIANDQSIIGQLNFDLSRQIICSQCSGALLLAKMGLLSGHKICTDNKTRLKLIGAGYQVMDFPFTYWGNIATAGGCLSAHYLASWVANQLLGEEAMEKALRYVVPVGEESDYISHVKHVISQ